MLINELAKLAEQEDRISLKVRELRGPMKELFLKMEQLGIFNEYLSIHQRYLSLCENFQSIEACKRALFIQWYETCEPECFTGIYGINPDSSKELLLFAEKIIVNSLDFELSWMLSYYLGMSDLWITDLKFWKMVPTLNKYLRRMSDVELPESIDISTMKKRGIMGDYWADQFENKIKQRQYEIRKKYERKYKLFLKSSPIKSDEYSQYKNSYVFIKSNPPQLFFINVESKAQRLEVDEIMLSQLIEEVGKINESNPLNTRYISGSQIGKFWELIFSNAGHPPLEDM